MLQSLQLFESNKSPGNDGPAVVSYRVLGGLLGQLLIRRQLKLLLWSWWVVKLSERIHYYFHLTEFSFFMQHQDHTIQDKTVLIFKNQGTYLQELQWFSDEQYICLELSWKSYDVKTMTYSFLIQLNARLFIKVRLLLFINKPGISSASER